jgi:hypothetical protein
MNQGAQFSNAGKKQGVKEERRVGCSAARSAIHDSSPPFLPVISSLGSTTFPN